MTQKITIALDCMGGDNAPHAVIKGAEISSRSNNNIHFLLYGNSDLINPLLKNCSSLKKNHTLFHTDYSISPDEKPSIALRKGTKSSMRLAINSVQNEDSDAMVSAGNTGALMTISKVILRSLPSIDRPAIVGCIPIIPNKKRQATVMLDMGANVDCNSEILYQFAVMGYAFVKTVLKINNPSIGLLNIGSEDLKGNDAVKNAAELIKESNLADAFYGYIEGDDICKGTVDVVVTDGFCGNIALKTIEGTAKMVSHIVKEGFASSLSAKIGYLFSKTSINKTFEKVDPRLNNGAMLVGLNGIVVKSHGGTDEIGFANAIKVAASLVQNKINQKIIKEIQSSNFDLEEENQL